MATFNILSANFAVRFVLLISKVESCVDLRATASSSRAHSLNMLFDTMSVLKDSLVTKLHSDLLLMLVSPVLLRLISIVLEFPEILCVEDALHEVDEAGVTDE
jgi:hypothetical protein